MNVPHASHGDCRSIFLKITMKIPQLFDLGHGYIVGLFGNATAAAVENFIAHTDTAAAIITANDVTAAADVIIGIVRMKVEVATNVQQSLQVRLRVSIVS